MEDPVETIAVDPQSQSAPDGAAAQTAPVAPARVASPAEPPRWLRYVADSRHAVSILLIVGVALYLVNLGGYPLYTKGNTTHTRSRGVTDCAKLTEQQEECVPADCWASDRDE